MQCYGCRQFKIPELGQRARDCAKPSRALHPCMCTITHTAPIVVHVSGGLAMSNAVLPAVTPLALATLDRARKVQWPPTRLHNKAYAFRASPEFIAHRAYKLCTLLLTRCISIIVVVKVFFFLLHERPWEMVGMSGYARRRSNDMQAHYSHHTSPMRKKFNYMLADLIPHGCK